MALFKKDYREGGDQRKVQLSKSKKQKTIN
jgi:hypothetical protein